jgi:hypothetical protein
MDSKKPTPIRELRPGRKQLLIQCLVIDIKSIFYHDDVGESVLNVKNEPLFSIWIGDGSGSIILTAWGDYSGIEAGDMLRLHDV